MKTVELMVRFTAEVEDDVNVENIFLDLDTKKIVIVTIGSICKNKNKRKIIEYETMEVVEI